MDCVIWLANSQIQLNVLDYWGEMLRNTKKIKEDQRNIPFVKNK